MALFNAPPLGKLVNEQAIPEQGWASFFSSVFDLLTALTLSGTTSNRPVKLLWVGRPYFDTTLNRPIWYTGSNWIRADGTVV